MSASSVLLCSTGMPGAGKGVLLAAAKKAGLPTASMGEVVRETAERLHGSRRADKVMDVGRRYRETHGEDIFARLTWKKLPPEDVLFVDGLRSQEEMDYFTSEAEDTKVIAVLCSPRERHRRLRERKREGESESRGNLEERDEMELEIGLGRTVAMADFFLVNQDKDVSAFADECERLLARITGKDRG